MTNERTRAKEGTHRDTLKQASTQTYSLTPAQKGGLYDKRTNAGEQTKERTILIFGNYFP